MIELLQKQPVCKEDGSGFVLATCPWIGEHTADYYPEARFDLIKQRFVCIHPSCVNRTYNEAVAQLRLTGAEAVSSANTTSEK